MLQHVLAAELGITQPTLSRYEHGRLPPVHILLRLRQLSGGAVTPNDWLADAAPLPAEPEQVAA